MFTRWSVEREQCLMQRVEALVKFSAVVVAVGVFLFFVLKHLLEILVEKDHQLGL